MRAVIASLALFVLPWLASTARAAPLDAALQQELLGLYDRYNQAMAKGNLADAASLRAKETRTELQALTKKPKAEREQMLTMARLMTPDSLSVQHASLSSDGNAASIIGVGTKTMPAGVKFPGAPKAGTVGRGELTLTFAREGTTWKFADQIFGPDPDKIKTCHDSTRENEDEYNHNSTTSEGGVIRRVVFTDDHTLVVIRIVDEEDCLILPPRERLVQNGGLPDTIVPWALIEVEGSPHTTDKQRMWAAKWTVTAE